MGELLPALVDLHFLDVVEPLEIDQQQVGVNARVGGFRGTVTVIVCSPERMRWLRR